MAFLLFILWLIRSVFSILESTYFWQLKEYRWDRMKEFLFQQNGRQYLISSFHIVYLVLIVVYLLSWAFSPKMYELSARWSPPFVSVLFLSECLRFAHHFLLKKFRRPRLTVKSFLILGSTFGLLMLPLVLMRFLAEPDYFMEVFPVLLAVLVVFEHDVNALSVTFLNMVSGFFKRRIFKKAQAKRLSRKDLIVIGITGSYGKTSVKEFLSHILSKKYNVLKTEKNTNTEIGISQTILQHLSPDHQVFVCEMGAYTKGEIRVCSQIARPTIGVFTGLNDQHVALFGTVDDTFKAKWELIQSLPMDGFSVFNGDSLDLKSRLKETPHTSVVCSSIGGDALAEDIVVHPESVEFNYKKNTFSAPLVGRFQVVNLLMALVVAEHLGMSLTEIAAQVRSLRSPEKTMNLSPFARGFLIDDSYNVNSDGLKQALLHLDQFPDHKKVLVFPGILELGSESPQIHQTLGKVIGHHVDYAFFTDPNFSEFLADGAVSSGLTRQHIYEHSDQDSIVGLLQQILADSPHESFVFLFESRGAEKVMEALKNLK